MQEFSILGALDFKIVPEFKNGTRIENVIHEGIQIRRETILLILS